jgi:CubicO group peptidase (beta-lactamase class C family)
MKKLATLVVVLAALAIGYQFLPFHVKEVTRLWFADADDYKHFPNDTLRTDHPKALPFHAAYGKVQLSEPSQDFLRKRKTGAFLVLQDGQIVYEWYDRGFDASTISGSFSMAKSVVSLLIGKAIDEGKIQSVQQPVKDFLPEYAFAADTQLTIHSLLTMSGGFDWKEMYINPFALTTKAYYGNDIESILKVLKINETPGKVWDYQSISTQVLAEVLMKATGETVTAYATKHLWQPLGMTNEALWSTDHPGGKERAFCCLSATALDYARLGQLVLQKGKWDSLQIIPSAYIAEAISPASYLSMKDGRKVEHYGYQFWIMHHKGYVAPYFCGILGQFIFVVPERNAVIVRIGQSISPRVDDTDQYKDGYTMLEAGLEVLDQTK